MFAPPLEIYPPFKRKDGVDYINFNNARTSINSPLTVSWLIPRRLTLYPSLYSHHIRENPEIPNEWDVLDWILSKEELDNVPGLDNLGQISLNDRKTDIIPTSPVNGESIMVVDDVNEIGLGPEGTGEGLYQGIPLRSASVGAYGESHDSFLHSHYKQKGHSHTLSLPLIPDPHNPLPPVEPQPTNPKLMGNVAMSSCPGKKVRLDSGPTNGKAMVCRDLTLDMRRLQSLGVGLIVNCLTDPELHHLGAPIRDYLSAAQECNVKVLRLPMLEGSIPANTTDLLHVMETMKQTTQQGTNVLIHCRGGIGRAGVVASCWLVYSKLVSIPKDPNYQPPPFYSHIVAAQQPNALIPLVPLHHPTVSHYFPPQDELEGGETIAKRAIRVVRMRRSHKAIETREQEEFVERFAKMLQ